MSKKSWIALLLVVGIPLSAYLAVKYFSEDAVVMPRRYFYDSVITKTVDGQLRRDTIWHKVSNFTFVNHLGDTVHADDVKGKILVVNYFFTRCPNPCPTLTRNMKKMQDSYLKNDSLVHFISFTVDPKRDSVSVLKNYADSYKIRHHNWWIMTGEKKKIYDLAFDEFKTGLVNKEGVDTAFIHTDKFYLLDKYRVIRGWYDGTDSSDMTRLARDISLLILEKDKTKKRNLFRK